MKKTYWLCMILLLCLILQGCPSQFVAQNHPTAQKGTTWISEDGKVCFTTDPGEYLTPCFGTVKTENGPVEIVIGMGPQTTYVDIMMADDFDINKLFDPFTKGQSDVDGEDEFVITITSSCNDIFEVGEVLVFHKLKALQ